MVTKRGAAGINQEFAISRYTLLYMNYINNEALLYSTGNYFQCPVVNCNEKESEKESVCVCIYIYIHVCVYILTHFAVHQKLIQHCKSTTLQ